MIVLNKSFYHKKNTWKFLGIKKRANRFTFLVYSKNIIFFVLFISLVGCATLPETKKLSDIDSTRIKESFTERMRTYDECPEAIDADVSLNFRSLIFSGALSGYLQAKKPAEIRFEGVNPLGLTESILSATSTDFNYIVVRERKFYSGRFDADKLKEKLPASLTGSINYNWLIGRLKSNDFKIAEIGSDSQGTGYWIDLDFENGRDRRKILFEPQQGVILRLLIISEQDNLDAEISYKYNVSDSAKDGSKEKCILPDKITFKYSSNDSVDINFNKRYPAAELLMKEFSMISAPKDYTRILIK